MKYRRLGSGARRHVEELAPEAEVSGIPSGTCCVTTLTSLRVHVFKTEKDLLFFFFLHLKQPDVMFQLPQPRFLLLVFLDPYLL